MLATDHSQDGVIETRPYRKKAKKTNFEINKPLALSARIMRRLRTAERMMTPEHGT